MAVIQDTNQADIVTTTTTTTTPASTAAADQISAGDGNDTVRGGSGNGLLHSDCGTDRAVHAGAPPGYAIATAAEGTVRDLNGAADGLDEGTGSTITRASISASGVQSDGRSFDATFSADGTKLAFSSDANNLAPGDTPAHPPTDVFLKDLVTGAIALVSTTASGGHGDSESYGAVLSADGTKVAFTSDVDLAPNEPGGLPAVFVKDMTTGAVTKAIPWAGGEPQLGPALDYQFSSDGAELAFSSRADVGLGIPAGIFIKDLASGALTPVSTSPSGEPGNGNSMGLSLSADASKVAFWSVASNLVSSDTNGYFDVFLKDLATGTVTLLSTSAGGEQGNGNSSTPSLSADGTKVAFSSDASNLVPGDTNGARDLFLADLTTGTVTRVSTSASGEQANGESHDASLSADGSHLAFTSAASNLVPGDTNGKIDVFLKDLTTGEVTLISTSASGEPGNGGSQSPALSAHGTEIAFESTASNLVPGDTNSVMDVFVRVLSGGGEAMHAVGPDDSLPMLGAAAATPLTDAFALG